MLYPFILNIVRGEPVIDQIFYLQNYAEPFAEQPRRNNTVVEESPCLDNDKHMRSGSADAPYTVDEAGRYRGWFWGYSQGVYARAYKCLSVHPFGNLVPWLLENVNDET